MNQNSNLSNSLSLTQLDCKINDDSAIILKIVNAKKKGSLYTKFVNQVLKYLPIDYRSRDQINLFGDFTDDAFNFFMRRSPSIKSKIEINISTFKNDPSITILVTTENKPFIIDSLKNLLLKFPLQTIFTFHPVIAVIRDKDGMLQNVVDKGTGGTNEALVYIKSLGSFDQDSLNLIKENIQNVIDLVNDTSVFWSELLNELIIKTTNIVHNKNTYTKLSLPVEETLDFVNWVQKDNFTFLGIADFDLESQSLVSEKGVKDIWQNNLNEISAIIKLSNSDNYKNKLVMLGKINKLSPVHRNALLDYILIKTIDNDGIYRSGTIIFGLYGSAMYFQSIKNIPMLRKKMHFVIKKSGFLLTGYNAKKIKNIIESLPRDILIQIDENDLYCMCIHMLSSMYSRKLKLFVQQDWSNSFVNVIIFMPRERLTPEVYKNVCCYLTKQFGNEMIADNITVVADDFIHLFVTISINDISRLRFCQNEMTSQLIQITTHWSEGLLQKLCEVYGEYKGSIEHKKIESSFPTEYKYKFNVNIVIEDLKYLKEASKTNKPVFNLIQDENKDAFILKLYSPEINLTLSDTLPLIENLGFIAIDEQSFLITESYDFQKSWIHKFKLTSPINIEIPFSQLKQNIEEAMTKVSENALTSDKFNKLLVLSGCTWQQVKLIQALTRYLHQTGFVYGKDYVQNTLIKHNKFVEILLNLFDARFNTDNSLKRNTKLLSKNIATYLEKVESNTEDKVLQNMYGIFSAISRTNFYQYTHDKIKDYLSFKFDSKKVPDLPLPLPYAEIFVYSNNFEAIHLSGAKVARGGIRWSDRAEDYRMEVLGLMKSQMTKNSVIVSDGAKGGFYIHFAKGKISQEEYMQKVISCYKNFLRGLLDITDNLIDGKIVHPKNTVIYDAPNPYLVVAADKGTATFSDYANAVSEEYNFWLRDAFASGGSAGYDHKKMGITAKGAWISVQSHFFDIGINVQKEPFTVIGIGDMSGDVFGNGMLLSKYIKLVAAFNHKHIFIDPTPDCSVSYKERKRLFVTPNTSWTDYNPKLISKGGVVFERSAKVLYISKEIQKLLEIDTEKITPDNLISSILKARVDLLWNGGIGTYVKSSNENNIDIGDKANDNLRINGKDLRTKVVVEGGNLGLSQLGRIEYALNGGRINTDFIDNSAGVDCSDHEVNIKIALNNALLEKKLTLQTRNNVLSEMTNDVEKLVLINNYDQNLAITNALLSNYVNIESFNQLIQELENKNLLDSEVEFLPDKSEISRRIIAGECMTRPELSVLLSYTKRSVDLDLSSYQLDDEYFTKYLFDYFPDIMSKEFKDEIVNHPLREEIIRTVITNKLVNRLGGVVISSIQQATGASIYDITKAYIIITEIFEIDPLWEQIAHLGKSVKTDTQIEMFSDIVRIIRRGISWFVIYGKHPININKTIAEFNKQIDDLSQIISKLLVGTTKTKFVNKIKHYTNSGIDKSLSQSIATLDVMVSSFDIIYIAKQTGLANDHIANLYFEIGDMFNIDWLRQSCETQINESYWNRLSIQSLKDDFYDKQRRLVTFIAKDREKDMSVELWLQNNINFASIFINFINYTKRQEIINLNMIILANKKLEIFLRKLKVEQ